MDKPRRYIVKKFKGSIPNLFMGIFYSVQHRRIVILIILCLSFKFNGIAFGYPELHLGHQFLPVYSGKDRMVRTFGIALWDTLYVRWSFGINVRFQWYWSIRKNILYPEYEPPKFIVSVREYLPYVTVDYALKKLNEDTKLYAGVGTGLLVITRQPISDILYGPDMPYKESDFMEPKPHAWIAPYVGIRHYIPDRGITLSLSLGLSHGFGRTELNNYLFLLGSIILFMR